MTKAPDVCLALCDATCHRNQYRPLLRLVHGPKHGPYQQLRLRSHHGPTWQCSSLTLVWTQWQDVPRTTIWHLAGPRSRTWTFALLSMTTGALDISMGPVYGRSRDTDLAPATAQVHTISWPYMAAHDTQVCMGLAATQPLGIKKIFGAT